MLEAKKIAYFKVRLIYVIYPLILSIKIYTQVNLLKEPYCDAPWALVTRHQRPRSGMRTFPVCPVVNYT